MRNVKNLTICVFVLGLVGTAMGATLQVPDNYITIQAAIEAADPGDQIDVAPGTYMEAINFKGKAITLRSTHGANVTTINGNGAYHVVQCVSGEGSDTVLEGFTITGGNANGPEHPDDKSGGGMYNSNNSSPTVTNCTFSGNTATYAGAGMSNEQSSPTVTNCAFTYNWLSGSLPTYGAGMFNSGHSSTAVINCTFAGNTSTYWGGGMHNSSSCYSTVINCAFTNNEAPLGGGMCNQGCQFLGVINCTFTDNTAGFGSGGMASISDNNMTVTNCILWGDTGGEIYSDNSSTPTVTYSDVEGGTGQTWFGEGCIEADPMFADADGRLLADSPCIDAGSDAAVPTGVTTDLDGNQRIQGECVDMGAFEAPPATPEAMLDGLRAYIVEQVGLGIDAEMEVSLLAKVDAAISALDRGNVNDAKVAMNDLKALVNQVEAQTDKKITPETAEQIITTANQIIAALGG